MPDSRSGDLLAGRYRLDDLLFETTHGRFWRGFDTVLARTVSIHALSSDDPRAATLVAAAQSSARVVEPHLLRVLDIDSSETLTFVINEWGSGISLDLLLASEGPLRARQAAWITSEVAAALKTTHATGVAHGRLCPENILIDRAGSIRIIGFAVEAAMAGATNPSIENDIVDLGGVLHSLLTAKWAGSTPSSLPQAPRNHSQIMTPRQIQAGVPTVLDELCARTLNAGAKPHWTPLTATEVYAALCDFVGDPSDLHAEALKLSALTGQPTSVGGRAEPMANASIQRDLEPTGPLALSDFPTQKGTPIFEDADHVGWFDPKEGSAPDPAAARLGPSVTTARPLFAPDQRRQPKVAERASGQIVVPTSGSASEDQWIFSTPAGVDEEDEKSSLGIFGIVAGLIALVVAGLVTAAVLTQGGPSTEETGAIRPSAVSKPTAVAGLTARDYDPESTPAEENPQLTPRAVDGDPATSWRTSTYWQQLGDQGLKSGVGLILDLGSSQRVTSLDLTFAEAGTTVGVYVTEEAPDGVPSGSTVASLEAGVQEEITLLTPTDGRYVTLWFKALPQVSDGFRTELVDATVFALPR